MLLYEMLIGQPPFGKPLLILFDLIRTVCTECGDSGGDFQSWFLIKFPSFVFRRRTRRRGRGGALPGHNRASRFVSEIAKQRGERHLQGLPDQEREEATRLRCERRGEHSITRLLQADPLGQAGVATDSAAFHTDHQESEGWRELRSNVHHC